MALTWVATAPRAYAHRDPMTTPASEPATSPAAAPPPTRDPVCGVDVDPAAPPGGTVERGRYRYHFCGAACRARFEAEPRALLRPRPGLRHGGQPQGAQGRPARARRAPPTTSATRSAWPGSSADPAGLPGPPARARRPPAAPPAAPPGAEVVWVCPMDPEVREKTPVPCPICGMGLEPLVVGGMPSRRGAGQPRAGQHDPPLLVGAGPDAGAAGAWPWATWLPGCALQHAIGCRAFALLQLALAAPVVLVGGWPFFERAWLSLRTWKLNMFTLIGIGTAAAFLFSAVATAAAGRALPGRLPGARRAAASTSSRRR